MTSCTRGLVLAVVVTAVGGPSAFAQGLTFRREAAGVQASGQLLVPLITNTFDSAGLAAYTTLSGSGNGVNTGTYTATGNGLGVFQDQFGGTGGSRYFSTGGRTSPTDSNVFLDPTATLTLSSTTFYFGLYWSAVDSSNRLDFYKGAVLVGTLTADYLLSDVGVSTNAYNGSGGNGTGQDTGEKHVYVNVYANDSNHDFDKIVFSNGTAGSGFESDTHTISTVSSPIFPVNQSGLVLVPVPEPIGLLAVSVGVVAVVRRRLRRR